MNPLMFSLALLCGLTLASVGLSIGMMFRVRAWVRSAKQRNTDAQEAFYGGLAEVRANTDGLAARIEEVRKESAQAAQTAPRSGLNLGKRSQALRMHRRGDTPEQIANVLEIPRQEVELLLKVHQIVMRSVV